MSGTEWYHKELSWIVVTRQARSWCCLKNNIKGVLQDNEKGKERRKEGVEVDEETGVTQEVTRYHSGAQEEIISEQDHDHGFQQGDCGGLHSKYETSPTRDGGTLVLGVEWQGSLEKDRTGRHNVVHRGPPSGGTDCQGGGGWTGYC